MTANALLSVSLEPPLVLVSIGRQNDSHAIIHAAGRFAVSILAAGQESLSIHFAQRFREPSQAMLGVAWTPSPGGLPWLDGALGHLECEVREEVPAQDHTLFLGRVLHVAAAGDDPPLLYFRSRYGTIR
jgi:flavin reductase (DIM6/NTAB) family NADH-FMN oxidoreductase RutF